MQLMSDLPGTTPGGDTPDTDAAVLVVMAREPTGPGVKTRLAASMGTPAAATLYAALLASTRHQVEVAGDAWTAEGHPRPRLVVALDGPASQNHPPSGIDPMAGAAAGDGRAPAGDLGEGIASSGPQVWDVIPQAGRTLGERLATVLARLFAEGSRAVVIVGSDSPSLPTEYLREALARTERVGEPDRPEHQPRLVLGPAFDGGYYLVALSRASWLGGAGAVTAVLEQTATSTATTFAATAAAGRAAGLEIDVLPYWIDVDHPADLRLAARLLAPDPLRMPGPPPALADRPPGADPPARGGPLAELRELYLHVTDRCRTGCAHCYNAGSASAFELSTAAWLDVVDQAVQLGATSFVLLGGDPFLRPDLAELLEGIGRHDGVRTRLFFNRPLDGAGARDLAAAGRGRLTPLLSVDGSRECNDVLRGRGNYDAALATAAALLAAGLEPVVNTVLLEPVLPGLVPMLDELARAGVTRMHLIFPHQRGGLGEGPGARRDLVPSAKGMASALDAVFAAAAERGITVDNLAGWRSRSSAPRDLCSAGCSMLAIDPTGRVHACPITAGDPGFVAGDLACDDLATIWRRSPSLHLLRHSHARDRVACAACDIVDLCGGECWVQAHYATQAAGAPMGYAAPFPYCDAIRPILTAIRRGDTPGPAEAGSGIGFGHRSGCGADTAVGADLTPFECI